MRKIRKLKITRETGTKLDDAFRFFEGFSLGFFAIVDAKFCVESIVSKKYALFPNTFSD